MCNVNWGRLVPRPLHPSVSRAAVFSHALYWSEAREWNITVQGSRQRQGTYSKVLKANRAPNSSGTIVFTLTEVRDHFRPQNHSAKEGLIEGSKQYVFIIMRALLFAFLFITPLFIFNAASYMLQSFGLTTLFKCRIESENVMIDSDNYRNA